jgi:signal transduction histidine kinase
MTANHEMAVLLVAPIGRDAELIRLVLQKSGVQSEAFSEIASATEALSSGNFGALLIAEEALGTKGIALLASVRAEQPAWSDVPVLVLTATPSHTAKNSQHERQLLPIDNVVLLDRPIRMATLVASIRAALRARSRQYERRLAEEALQQSEKFAVIGRLSASVAHEINNPLEAISNVLYLLDQTALNPQQQQYLHVAQEELQRVAEIAAHTLTFNRHSNVRGAASVSVLLDSALALYRSRLTSSGVVVESRHQNTPPLRCYPGELRQLFANLIGNAFDATRKGGRILVRERYAVHPNTGQPGIRIILADTGHGMGADVKAHLFEPFHSTKGRHGNGLGLWISKGIVDKHGGSLRFRSSTKQGSSGTVFSIFLPLDLDSSQRPLARTGT